MNVKRGDNIIYLHLQERLRCSLCRNQQTQAITLSTLIWRNKPYSEHFFNILLSHEVINTPSLNLNFVIYWKWAYDLLSANCWNKASFVLGELISNYLHFAMCLPWTILFLGGRCVLGMVRRYSYDRKVSFKKIWIRYKINFWRRNCYQNWSKWKRVM